MTRLLAIGDLHLGAGSDYGREPGDRLRDQEQVWARALELAVEHQVAAVLFAGDAFHRRRPTPAEMVAFQRPLRNLFDDHGIETLAILGNHDVEATNLPTALEVFGREVQLHTEPGLWLVPDSLPAEKHTDLPYVATLPWCPVSRLVAARGGGDRDDVVQEAAGLLIAAARGLRADIPAGHPAILMLHWSVSGASTPTGAMTDDFREVVLPIDELEALGFDAVIAGHIHKPQLIGTDWTGSLSSPKSFYTGSPAPVDFGEADSEHGVWLLDIEPGKTKATFLPIESRPFVTVDADLTTGAHDQLGLDVTDAIAAAIAAHVPLDDAVVRVRYRATEEQACRIDWPKLKPLLDDAHKIFAISGEITRSDRARVIEVTEDLAPLDALGMWIDANDVNGHREPLVATTAKYLEEGSS